jgi:hypothetical protein
MLHPAMLHLYGMITRWIDGQSKITPTCVKQKNHTISNEYRERWTINFIHFILITHDVNETKGKWNECLQEIPVQANV